MQKFTRITKEEAALRVRAVFLRWSDDNDEALQRESVERSLALALETLNETSARFEIVLLDPPPLVDYLYTLRDTIYDTESNCRKYAHRAYDSRRNYNDYVHDDGDE